MFPCYQYYIEIKNRSMLLLFTWVSLLIVCYDFKEPLLFIFIDSNKYYNNMPYFIFTNVDEIFYVYLRLILFIANQITIIMALYHGLMFLTLGLYYSEYKQLKLILKIFIITWLCSIILLRKIIMPFSWSFFLSFQETNNHLQPASFFFEARILEYFDYFTNFYYLCVMNCQLLTLSVLFLNKISKETGTIKTFRKLFYLVFILFSTITTPPDIFSQIIMSTSLILIYEILVFLKYIKT
uniref:Sec-independent protein translocase component TatC n=1 Tax=Pseudo-nitzschia cuspidata TaxID=237455 RepID=A0A888TTV9_9STRA|nr:Sec-independent protein translocase component TatC [Pseudo-nitzschia cuspidata]QRC12167.1 Sec-independent protein translocase component TatC [Pseudo-nitzschia cuspidata]